MQILQTIPANTVALEGAVFNGTNFFTDRGDGQPIHPFTTQRTKQGSVLWPQFAPPRQNSTARLAGERRSINTGDAELYMQCEVAGTTGGTAPVVNYAQIGTTVVDGTVTWRVKGLHAFKGFANWPARTNLCLWGNDLTNALWGVNALVKNNATTMTATSTGTSVYCTQGIAVTPLTTYTLSMDVGNGTANGLTTAVYNVTGSAFISIDLPMTKGTRFTHTFTTPAGCTNINIYRVRGCTSTGTIITSNAQLEAASFASPYIATTTATVTRAATNLSLPTAGNIRSNDFGVDMWVIPGGAGQTTQPFATYTDANNETSIAFAAGTVAARKRLAGVNNDATATYTHAAATPVRVQVYFSSETGVGVRVRQTGGNWTAWATNANVTAASIATVLQVGGANNGNHFAGNYPATSFVLHSDPKAELERLAAIDDAWVAGQI